MVVSGKEKKNLLYMALKERKKETNKQTNKENKGEELKKREILAVI